MLLQHWSRGSQAFGKRGMDKIKSIIFKLLIFYNFRIKQNRIRQSYLRRKLEYLIIGIL
jgi:hypothetical protein